ncbi:bifunctional pyr operon transcriptional regulator/uracil phosphoribosyltransferase PyrR [Gloeobacter kilaueensis]|uniref:Bifunctional protein PyrR n=1 Tax=Gloeobacter kilaueensis (strain ATCC BAA-2537 / CCAP 1431/1 / ULC 316 / JS1) TaxID=1183438 RepID=U5QDJ7_GLOK1|nr:bifunctional pyr operon transcriptional regulator/uracil phosphoribosyltransferase PyrR [Gloeobacter kilaueensis]AGY57007.1 bifunctional pyrimidine regulatory protein PyrR uracil phosphoribosyltransferase [Gloeobacter kilaueensis JS1]
MTREPVEILSAIELRRTLQRLATQIVEHNRGTDDLVLLGIYTRGVPLARRLGQLIAGLEETAVPVGALDITLYRDDLRDIGVRPLTPSEIPVDITARNVYLIDDVIYRGRTVRAALDALNDYGRPAAIRLVSLIDRGWRDLPIHPDLVGRKLPTARHEQVKVLLEETDGRDGVLLY